MLTAAGQTDIGRVRDHNEDRYATDAEQGLFIVSDGLGGHSAGELASKVVVEALPGLIKQHLGEIQDMTDSVASDRLIDALKALSTHLRAESEKYPGLSGMGATVVCALVRNGCALIAHMGDSRAYLLRRECLKQLTRDHSIVQILIENGELTPEEAKTHPARSQITQYAGMYGEPLPELRFVRLEEDDRLLLCSDGLTGMVPDRDITDILHANPDPKHACRALIEDANRAGGKDNITVVVVNYAESK